VRRPALGAFLLLALSAGPGCTGWLGQSPPPPVQYVLRPERTAPPASPGSRVLRVGQVRAAPLFERQGFLYRTDPERYVRDFYHRFYAPPGVVIQEAATEWLRASGLFAAVLDPGQSGVADWILEGRVERLYADRRRDPPEAVLEVQVTLLDADELELLLQRRYAAVEPAPAGDPAGLAAAWSRALGRVLAELEADLAGVLSGGERPPRES